MKIQRLELYNLPILTLSPLNVQETLPRHRTSSLAPRRRARRLGSAQDALGRLGGARIAARIDAAPVELICGDLVEEDGTQIIQTV